VFVLGEPLLSGLRFVIKAGTNPSGVSIRLLVILANIKTGWKGLRGTNNLAYFVSSSSKVPGLNRKN
jgi:hypothetical protein